MICRLMSHLVLYFEHCLNFVLFFVIFFLKTNMAFDQFATLRTKLIVVQVPYSCTHKLQDLYLSHNDELSHQSSCAADQHLC